VSEETQNAEQTHHHKKHHKKHHHHPKGHANVQVVATNTPMVKIAPASKSLISTTAKNPATLEAQS
jgi:hypothetical protein